MNEEQKPRGRPMMDPDERASSQIQLRVSRKRKGAYVRKARPGPLAGWMFSVCDMDSEFDGIEDEEFLKRLKSSMTGRKLFRFRRSDGTEVHLLLTKWQAKKLDEIAKSRLMSKSELLRAD